MPVNMGSVDRFIRSVIVAPALIVIAAVIGPVGVASVILYALAAIMLLTSAVSFCPLYAPIKMSTCSRTSSDTPAGA